MKPLDARGLRVLLLLAALTVAACGSSPGPLDGSAWPGPVEVGTRAEVGERVAFGGPELTNGSDEDVVIRSVTFSEADSGVTMLGWELRRPGPAEAGTGTDRLSVPGSEPGPGERSVAPTSPDERNPQLVVGVRLDEPGRHAATRLVIEYTARTRSHRLTFPFTVVMCHDDGSGSCDAEP